MTAWTGFFQVQAGASASLLGLVFVGLSINFQRIIDSKYLPNRALEGLLCLFLNLLVASLFLVPNQPARVFGWEVLVLAGLLWGCATGLHRHTHSNIEDRYRRRALVGTAVGQATAMAWTLGAIAVLVLGPPGLGWLVPAFLLSYSLSLLTAWVLLVEINR